MMRIAINASIFDLRASGLGVYARALVRALVGLHPNLVVYTSRPEEMPHARPIPPWGEPSRGGTGHLWRLLWTQTGLPRRARRDRADVLLNVLPEGPLRPILPQISVVHDLIPLVYPDEFPRRQWYFRSFIPHVLRASRWVIADSAQTRADAIERYRLCADRVAIALPAVDHDRFRPYPQAPSVAAHYGLHEYVLYVGNLRPHKNLLRLLEAFAALRGGVMLAIAGYRDPRYAPQVERRVRELGLDRRVQFLGFVPSEVLPMLYGAALVTVVPSLYEGFGLPVLEAMACGSPVVASTAGGLREAAGEAAVLVDPRDVGGWSKVLEGMLSSPSLCASLRERGLRHAQTFRWEDTATTILAIASDVRAG